LLNIMLGVEWIECYDPITRLHYSDAVGDVGLISDIWGPSIGTAQIRALRDPTSGNAADRWRVASKLQDPLYNAQAARAIVGPSGENLRLWSAYKNGSYLAHVGQDFVLHTGHFRAHLWNI
jgi:hypothetical protein